MGYENVWLGVSVEGPEQMHRVETLCEVSAIVRFVSFEPLLEPIEFSHFWRPRKQLFKYLSQGRINWAIIGGESGNKEGKYRYRSCELAWIYILNDAMRMFNIPVFIKQLGTHLARELGLRDRHGGIMSEWPEDLRVREFPKVIV